MNRYYSNAYGRFMTPDPYTNSGRLSDPQSWNRYAYTRGDPVNRVDLTGTDDTPTFSITVLDLINTPPIISWPQQSAGGGWGTAQYWASAIGSALAVATSWQQLATENFQAKSELESMLQSQQGSGCLNYLEANAKGGPKSFNQLMQDASGVTFIDTTGVGGTLTTSDVGIQSQNSNETLAQYFLGAPCPAPEATCTATAVTPLGTPIVLLGSNYSTALENISFGNSSVTINVPTTTAFQQDTLFHAFFHVEGIGDLGGSVAFDNWLQGGCQGNPPSQ